MISYCYLVFVIFIITISIHASVEFWNLQTWGTVGMLGRLTNVPFVVSKALAAQSTSTMMTKQSSLQSLPSQKSPQPNDLWLKWVTWAGDCWTIARSRTETARPHVAWKPFLFLMPFLPSVVVRNVYQDSLTSSKQNAGAVALSLEYLMIFTKARSWYGLWHRPSPHLSFFFQNSMPRSMNISHAPFRTSCFRSWRPSWTQRPGRMLPVRPICHAPVSGLTECCHNIL